MNTCISGEVVAVKEQKHSGDMGCEYSKSCLECPLPYCKDDPGVKRRLLREKRRKQDKEVADLWQQGKEAKEIAKLLGISKRTAQRRLHRAGIRGG